MSAADVVSALNVSDSQQHGNTNGVSQQQQSSSSSSSSPVIEYWEPSYRTRPVDSAKFVPKPVESIIRDVMERSLKTAVFDDATCKVLALELCSEIKERVKSLSIPRYKVVLQSVLGEVKGQGAYIASRCLWDTDTDNYAAFSMKNSSLFCVVMVFGLYLE
jgi:tctex1 domain-containing protein 2